MPAAVVKTFFRIASDTNQEFGRVIGVVKAGELLAWARFGDQFAYDEARETISPPRQSLRPPDEAS
ncbi:MAG TPA: hypothetical protein VK745_13295 [Polyangiaceae bacterium]|nr:hypothetical protein [Polyangiaceae bacterium]